jgi:fumarate hydratase subunit alpha
MKPWRSLTRAANQTRQLLQTTCLRETMREVPTSVISDAVARMCLRANLDLPDDVRVAIKAGAESDRTPLARRTLLRILENADVASREHLPMCQDTGLVVLFVELGQDAHLVGGSIRDAINEGVRRAWREGRFRASVTTDPILRGNSGDNTPAIVHFDVVPGDTVRLRLLAKGGGCENMSRFRMLTPAEGTAGIVKFVTETAVEAGPNACPPMIVGVGVGGSFEYSALLAKRALLRATGHASAVPHVAELERAIFNAINASGVGPQGYGGDTTALAVHIETSPSHIASLPVSVNIECHAHRHQETVL